MAWGEPAGDGEWQWTVQRYGPLNLLGCLTFVREVDPAAVIEAFGLDPTAARLLTSTEARQAATGAGSPTTLAWVRVGRVDDWTFAIEDGDLTGSSGGVARRLSQGREAVAISYVEGAALGNVEYFVDGAAVTSFEPLLASIRYGTEPDRFLPQMRLVGLDVDGGADIDLDEYDPMIAALEMLTLALGIRLPYDVATGPVLTAAVTEASD